MYTCLLSSNTNAIVVINLSSGYFATTVWNVNRPGNNERALLALKASNVSFVTGWLFVLR